MFTALSLCLYLFVSTEAVLNAVPKWPAIYQMNMSTICMPCNESGWFSDYALTQLARYGIVDIDWSNAKQLWASTSPMDCQQRLLTQAQTIKSINPKTKVFVYRNFVKALPWFTDVREKILDPAYNKWWFLSFKENGPYHVPPCTNTTINKCSTFYHDQEQTPHYPAQCTVNQCDCGGGANNGNGLPCGEYLWDHRNASLRKWLTDVHIMGAPNGTGLNNAAIDGFYIDDGWRHNPNSNQCDGDPFGGPTEENKYCIQDMGLTQEDVTNITTGWQESMANAQAAIVAGNGFNWQLMSHANSPSNSSCAGWLRGTGMRLNSTALQFTYKSLNDTQEEFEIDLAMFLLVRGPYAWLGYTWNGCHSVWEYGWNDMLDKDYGEPKGPMTEIKTGVFQREWTKVTVEMDCNQYKPSFNFNI